MYTTEPAWHHFKRLRRLAPLVSVALRLLAISCQAPLPKYGQYQPKYQ
jgi:hypothetical protein